jgi:Na+/phosphate symporter
MGLAGRSALLLRIASGLTLVFAAGHAMGASESWSPPGPTDVLQMMRTFQFDVMGDARTYWHFYVGFGAYITVLLLMQAVLLWQVASLARSDALRTRPIIATVLAANIAGTLVAWRFIFLMPALFSLVCTLCLVLAFIAAKPAAATLGHVTVGGRDGADGEEAL